VNLASNCLITHTWLGQASRAVSLERRKPAIVPVVDRSDWSCQPRSIRVESWPCRGDADADVELGLLQYHNSGVRHTRSTKTRADLAQQHAVERRVLRRVLLTTVGTRVQMFASSTASSHVVMVRGSRRSQEHAPSSLGAWDDHTPKRHAESFCVILTSYFNNGLVCPRASERMSLSAHMYMRGRAKTRSVITVR
jgi:hypothetical protein